MLIVLATGLTVVVVLLAIPVDVTVSVQRHNAPRGHVIVAWLFGLVRYSPKTEASKPFAQETRRAKAPSETRKPKPEEQPHQKAKQNRGIQHAFTVLQTRGFVRRIIKLLFHLFKRIRIRVLTIQGRIGLGDPADTGRLWGMISAMSGVLALAQHAIFALEPDFERAIFEIDGQGVFRIIPLQILIILTLFILSPPTIRATWTGVQVVRQAKRERKEKEASARILANES